MRRNLVITKTGSERNITLRRLLPSRFACHLPPGGRLIDAPDLCADECSFLVWQGEVFSEGKCRVFALDARTKMKVFIFGWQRRRKEGFLSASEKTRTPKNKGVTHPRLSGEKFLGVCPFLQKGA